MERHHRVCHHTIEHNLNSSVSWRLYLNIKAKMILDFGRTCQSNFKEAIMKIKCASFILCVCMALSFFSTNAAASVVNAETDQPIVIGAGYDPAFGVILDECVEWKKSTEEKPDISSGSGAKAISYNLSLIENIEELEKSLGLSASAKYGAASGKASFSSSIKMNSYNVYILVEVKVKNQANTISRVSLHKEGVATT